MTAAYTAFLASMEMNLEKWREGIGYDLDAISRLDECERHRAVKALAEKLRNHPDWRDIEALGAIGTSAARRALRDALKNDDRDIRARAAEQLREMDEDADLDSAIVEALRNTGMMTGFSHALDMAEEHPSPRIQETLLDLALNGDEEEKRINAAALALYLGAKAGEAFDWNHRPFFLQFGEARKVRIAAWRELCERLGVDPKVSE